MFKKWGIWILIVLFALIYSVYSVVRHLRMETYIFDLGYYDQLIWLASHGKKIYSSILESLPWIDHFSPSVFLLTPLYWIWDSPLALLTFQAVFISFGAYPIYKLSINKTKSNLFSLTLSFCYLIFYGLQNAISYDFHAVALGPTLLAFIFWFYEEKRFKFFWLALLIFAGLQENFLIFASAYGVFLIFKYKDYKRGIPIFVGGLLLFLSLIYFIIPRIFAAQYYYVTKPLETSSFFDIVKKLYTPSSKIDVVVFSLTAFGFLPLLSPPFLVILAEEFLGRFLMTTNSNWWILGFHYNAILAPVLAFSSICAFEKYFTKKEILASVLIVTGTLISLYRVKPDIPKMLNKSYYDFSKTYAAREVIKEIPQDASVASSNNLGAQIAHRKGLIFLTNCVENPKEWGPDSKRCFNLKPDYILADMDPYGSDNNFYPDYERDAVERYIDYVQKEKEYELVKKVDWVYLLKKIAY